MTINDMGVSSSDLLKWLLGIIATVLMLFAGASMAENRARIDRIEERVQSTERTTIELNASGADMGRRLIRIEDKLDRVLGLDR